MDVSDTLKSFFFNLFKARVRGGVLQLTLGIGLIVAVISSSMILMAYYARLTILQSEIKNSLRDNAESGIQYMIAKRETPFYQPETFDLFEDGIDSVQVIRKPWGLYELVVCRALRGANGYSKSALVTSMFSNETESALYIPENNSSIYLVGDTRITGTVFVPERKFTTGYVNGRNYEGGKLLYGEYKKSDYQMPELDTTLFTFVKQLAMGNQYERVKVIERLPSNGIFSFAGNDINYFFSEQPIELSDSIQGNIVIHSSSKVVVNSNATLSDVIVMAPEIEIQKGFIGSAQFFATKLITVEDEVSLTYPSSLSLIGQSSDSLISIGKDARVEGIVLIQGFDRDHESSGVFKIEKGGVFHGVAYINGSADIQGAIWGHLTAKRVQASVGTTVYSNHLLDAEISYPKKSPFMPASLLWGSSKEIAIARWIE
jgi:hypothetical protein